jgi:hypothetical protein
VLRSSSLSHVQTTFFGLLFPFVFSEQQFFLLFSFPVFFWQTIGGLGQGDDIFETFLLNVVRFEMLLVPGAFFPDWQAVWLERPDCSMIEPVDFSMGIKKCLWEGPEDALALEDEYEESLMADVVVEGEMPAVSIRASSEQYRKLFVLFDSMAVPSPADGAQVTEDKSSGTKGEIMNPKKRVLEMRLKFPMLYAQLDEDLLAGEDDGEVVERGETPGGDDLEEKQWCVRFFPIAFFFLCIVCIHSSCILEFSDSSRPEIYSARPFCSLTLEDVTLGIKKRPFDTTTTLKMARLNVEDLTTPANCHENRFLIDAHGGPATDASSSFGLPSPTSSQLEIVSVVSLRSSPLFSGVESYTRIRSGLVHVEWNRETIGKLVYFGEERKRDKAKRRAQRQQQAQQRQETPGPHDFSGFHEEETDDEDETSESEFSDLDLLVRKLARATSAATAAVGGAMQKDVLRCVFFFSRHHFEFSSYLCHLI